MKAIFGNTVGKAKFLAPVVIAVVAILLISNLAYAYTTSNLKILQIREDRFWNYDFLDDVVSSTGVSCPVTMLFYNNAWVNKVKNMYWGVGPPNAVSDHARLNDGNSWIWDSDRGTKAALFSQELGAAVWVHLRVYVPNPPDYMANVGWGKYVIGTTHFDEYYLELWYGYNEYAEEICADHASALGYSVFEDCTPFSNYEPYRAEPIIHPILHIPTFYYWDNSGRATAVYVP